MSEQPKALQLADGLEQDPSLWGGISKVAWPAAAELRRLHQADLSNQEWLDKTEWVQATIQPSELGQHRADVIKQRLDLVTAQRDELLEAAKRMQAWVSVLLNTLDAELDSFEVEVSNSKTGASVTLSLKEHYDMASATTAQAGGAA